MTLRYWLVLNMVIVVLVSLSRNIHTRLVANEPHITGALLGGLVAGAATALGLLWIERVVPHEHFVKIGWRSVSHLPDPLWSVHAR